MDVECGVQTITSTGGRSGAVFEKIRDKKKKIKRKKNLINTRLPHLQTSKNKLADFSVQRRCHRLILNPQRDQDDEYLHRCTISLYSHVKTQNYTATKEIFPTLPKQRGRANQYIKWGSEKSTCQFSEDDDFNNLNLNKLVIGLGNLISTWLST